MVLTYRCKKCEMTFDKPEELLTHVFDPKHQSKDIKLKVEPTGVKTAAAATAPVTEPSLPPPPPPSSSEVSPAAADDDDKAEVVPIQSHAVASAPAPTAPAVAAVEANGVEEQMELDGSGPDHDKIAAAEQATTTNSDEASAEATTTAAAAAVISVEQTAHPTTTEGTNYESSEHEGGSSNSEQAQQPRFAPKRHKKSKCVHGFTDLGHYEFSAKSFPHIAEVSALIFMVFIPSLCVFHS